MGGLIWLAIVLAIIWLLAVVFFKVAGFLIHIVLIVAVILFVLSLIRRAT
jgi:hypothetical protein